MTELSGDIETNRDLVKLLRHIGTGKAVLCAAVQADCVLVDVPGKPARQHRQAALEKAVVLGLARRTDDRLEGLPQAASFLKRALAGNADDAFASQHRVTVRESVVEDGQQPRRVTRNLAESPLLAMSRLKDRDGSAFLPVKAIEAGERLHADFTRAQLQPRITASWEPRIAGRGKGEAGGQQDLCDSAVAARQRFGRAADAMGPELSGVAIDICCFGKGLETVERERQWPVRSAKLMLRTALLALSRHYAPEAPSRSVRHWAAQDYRPSL